MFRCIFGSIVVLGIALPSAASGQQGCKAGTETTKLPTVSAVLDSAALIRNLPAPELAAAKEVIVSVTTTPTPRAVVLDSVMVKTGAGRVLAQRVVASLKPNARSLSTSFGLRIVLGEAPTLAVIPAMVCPPKS